MKVTRRSFGILVVVLALLTAGLVGAEEQPLSNSDIIKLTKLGMGDEVIIAKIKTAKEVKFNTSTDDLITLKKSGVSGPIIAAMLERSVPGEVSGTSPAKGPGTPKVALVSKEGTFDIKVVSGDLQIVRAPFIGSRRYVLFSGTTSATRINDNFPTLLLNIDRDPHQIWWLVKLTPWDVKGRVIDLPSIGRWGGTISNAPDESCDIQYAAIEEKPGLWRITPKGELMPGEYGLFHWAGNNPSMRQGNASLYDFRVDK